MISAIFKKWSILNKAIKTITYRIYRDFCIPEFVLSTLSEQKGHGCQFALDDFGSGLSSFAYLKNLPVNYLKIDGSFVRDISRDMIDRTMVESIQQIGSVMHLTTIAEHVEDEPTLNILEEIGVDYAQGFHLGRPQAIEDDERA